MSDGLNMEMGNQSALRPIILRPEEKTVCKKMDDFFSFYDIGRKPSDCFIGAVWAARPENYGNPDWFAQAMHSFREILYPFFYSGSKIKIKKLKAFENYRGAANNSLTNERIGRFYGRLENNAHHNGVEDFENIRQEFVKIIRIALSSQLDMHLWIDEFITAGVETANVEVGQGLVNFNLDSKRYFFSKADEKWFAWLKENGFLDKTGEKAENTEQYSYTMPELDYLTKVASSVSQLVADFILSVQISEDSFNPEVVDRFIWMVGEMSAKEISLLTSKIKNDNWFYLMRKFNKSGFEAKRIIDKLVSGKEDKALLEIGAAVLILTDKIASDENEFGSGYPFWLHDITQSGIFEALAGVGDDFAEAALKLTTETMDRIIKRGKPDGGKLFDYQDSFSLYDVDFFTLGFGNDAFSRTEDIKNLAAVIVLLTKRLMKCDDAKKSQEIYKHIENIGLCRSTWRLRLFVMAQCPVVFKDELKDAFYKLFDNPENYYEIISGAEYKKALQVAFPVDYGSDYVKKVLEYFSKLAEKHPDQAWHKRNGWEILSSICESLTGAEQQQCEEKFGSKCDAEYVPEPVFSGVRSGSVSHRAPDDIGSLEVDEIVKRLKNEYRPEELNKKFQHDDIFSPRGPEGLGDALKEDIKKRTDKYLEKLNEFFEPGLISAYYVYSLLRGIEELLSNKVAFNIGQAEKVLSFFQLVTDAGSTKPFEPEKIDGAWLADWIAVHKVSVDVLLQLLSHSEFGKQLQKEKRPEILVLIKYFLGIKSSPADKDEREKGSDLFSIAINSVRGRAFETLVVFAQNDGDKLETETKHLFEDVLKDSSLAVRFLVGHYLATFYFRDKDYIKKLLPSIFSKDSLESKDAYLAVWEGYLSNTLYSQLFDVLGEYYKFAIKQNSANYTDRKYFKDLDEALAVHIALAFAHLNLQIGDPLFELFWKTANQKRHHEFISFIGRSCLTRGDAGDEWLKKNNVDKKKLIKFWDWALENVLDPKILSAFGYWVNPNKEVLDDKAVLERISKTLEISNGDIEWEYGLMGRLLKFAEIDPEIVLTIIRIYLLGANDDLNPLRDPWGLHVDQIKVVLAVICKVDGYRQKVEKLIDILIDRGSNRFWTLKDVLR